MKKDDKFIKRALLTGATGFTGSHVMRELLKAGWKVDILIRPSSSINLIENFLSNVNIHKFDGNDIGDLTSIVSSVSPNVVIHIASEVIGDHKPSDVTGIIKSNILFGSLLLEAMTHAGVKNFINTGTYWEHYDNLDYSPVGLYAASKFAFQNILQYYIDLNGINAITLKLFDTYGPNDPRPKLMNLLLKASLTGDYIEMTKGEQKIDLIHVEDVAAAYLLSTKRLSSNLVSGHEVFGVSGGNRLSVKEVVELFQTLSGQKLNIKWGARNYRKREVMEPCNLPSLPNWSPKISLRNGISSLLTKDK
jgi:nucleoside-diphosphate-sugar epimerase